MIFLVFRVFSSLAVVRTQKILRNLHFDRNQLLLINQIQKSSSLSFTNPIIARTHQLAALLIKRFSVSNAPGIDFNVHTFDSAANQKNCNLMCIKTAAEVSRKMFFRNSFRPTALASNELLSPPIAFFIFSIFFRQ